MKHDPKDLLLDIDLDIFNRSGYWATGDLWTDTEIAEFLEGCSALINSSRLITIAMSFNYSGSKEDTKHLVRLVIPTVVEIFRHKRKKKP